jgi:polyisoprenoid-binding protein YceI
MEAAAMHTLGPVRTRAGHEIPVPGVYAIDPAHTQVEFVVRHLAITKVRGRFVDVAGTITVDEIPEHSSVQAEVGMASVDTGNPDRDDHLRSADFFDVAQHPTMAFASTRVRMDGDAWMVDGDLALRGVTRPVTLRVEFDGSSTSPAGDERISFSASADIDREDWGLTWNQALETGGVVVSKHVRIELNVQAIAAR